MQLKRVNGVVGGVIGASTAYMIGQRLIVYGVVPTVLGILVAVTVSLLLSR